ncbi:hypothetical protein KKD62_03015 [Patescibacteria group bacterium]|nr:hypothetical protein [Patescibacteria group bacterium]MBU1931503.1 hypothetical protein [Patescibacteria group bacterium]
MPKRNVNKKEARIALLKGAARFWAINPNTLYLGYSPDDKNFTRVLEREIPGFNKQTPNYGQAAEILERKYPHITATTQTSGPLDKIQGRIRGLGGPKFEEMVSNLHVDQLNATLFQKQSPNPFLGPNKELIKEAADYAAKELLEPVSAQAGVTLEDISQNPELKIRTQQIIDRTLALQEVKNQVAESTLKRLPPVFKQHHLQATVYQISHDFLEQIATPLADEFATSLSNTPKPSDPKAYDPGQQVSLGQIRFNQRIKELANHPNPTIKAHYYRGLHEITEHHLQPLHLPDEQIQSIVEQVKTAIQNTLQQETIAPQVLYKTTITPDTTIAGRGNQTDIELKVITPPVSWQQRVSLARQAIQQNWKDSTLLIGGANKWLNYIGPQGLQIMFRSTLSYPHKKLLDKLGSGGFNLLHHISKKDVQSALSLSLEARSRHIRFSQWKMALKHPIWFITNQITQLLIRKPLNFLLLSTGLAQVKYKTIGFGKLNETKFKMYKQIVFAPREWVITGIKALPKASLTAARWTKNKTAPLWQPIARATRPFRQAVKKRVKDFLSTIYKKTIGLVINKITGFFARVAGRIGLEITRFTASRIGQAFFNSRFGTALKSWAVKGMEMRFASFVIKHPFLSGAAKFLFTKGLSGLFNAVLWITDFPGMFISNIYLGSPGGFLGGTAGATIGFILGGIPGAIIGGIGGGFIGHLIWTNAPKILGLKAVQSFLGPALSNLLSRFFQLFHLNPGTWLGTIAGYFLGTLLGWPLWATSLLSFGLGITGTLLWLPYIQPFLAGAFSALTTFISGLISSLTGTLSAAIAGLTLTTIIGAFTIVTALTLFVTTVIITSIMVYQDARMLLAPNESACFQVIKEYSISGNKQKAEAGDIISYNISIIPKTTVTNAVIEDHIIYRLSMGTNIENFLDPEILNLSYTSVDDFSEDLDIRPEFQAIVLKWQVNELSTPLEISYQVKVSDTYVEGEIENTILADGQAVDDQGEKLQCLISYSRFVNGNCREAAEIALRFVEALSENSCSNLDRVPLFNYPIINRTTWPTAEICLENASIPQATINRLGDWHLANYSCAQCLGTVIAWAYGAGITGWPPAEYAGAMANNPPAGYSWQLTGGNENLISAGDMVVWNDNPGHIAMVTKVNFGLLGGISSLEIAEALGEYEIGGVDYCGAVRIRPINYGSFTGFLHCEQ